MDGESGAEQDGLRFNLTTYILRFYGHFCIIWARF